jgi:hypothetical protein
VGLFQLHARVLSSGLRRTGGCGIPKPCLGHNEIHVLGCQCVFVVNNHGSNTFFYHLNSVGAGRGERKEKDDTPRKSDTPRKRWHSKEEYTRRKMYLS